MSNGVGPAVPSSCPSPRSSPCSSSPSRLSPSITHPFASSFVSSPSSPSFSWYYPVSFVWYIMAMSRFWMHGVLVSRRSRKQRVEGTPGVSEAVVA